GDAVTADGARALVRRVQTALGPELAAAPDVEREFVLDAGTPATWWLTIGFVVGYLALAFALSHWLFAHAELVWQREPVVPLVLLPYGAIAYWAWRKVGAASARARLIAELR